MLSEISAISKHLEKNVFLSQSADAIAEYLSLYFVGLYLIDTKGEWAVFCAGNGEFGKRIKHLGHKIRIQVEREFGWQAGTAIGMKEIRLTRWLSGDILGYTLPVKGQVPFRPVLKSKDEIAPFCSPILPKSACELFLPMRTREEIIGVLEVHSEASSDFKVEAIEALQRIADFISDSLAELPEKSA